MVFHEVLTGSFELTNFDQQIKIVKTWLKENKGEDVLKYRLDAYPNPSVFKLFIYTKPEHEFNDYGSYFFKINFLPTFSNKPNKSIIHSDLIKMDIIMKKNEINRKQY